MIKKLSLALFILGLIYILLPGPTTIDQFKPLPISKKSSLPGDTTQNPNIAAYYSDNSRDFIKNFYKAELERNVLLGDLLPVTTIIRSPQEAYQFIRDQQESTHLVEYSYPFRESLYVNLVEPMELNRQNGRPPEFVADHVDYQGNYYSIKTTIRFYTSKLIYRIIEYLGICLSVVLLYKTSRKAFKGVY